jgi:hypothetical protein
MAALRSVRRPQQVKIAVSSGLPVRFNAAALLANRGPATIRFVSPGNQTILTNHFLYCYA